MNIEIKNRFSGSIIICGEYVNIREAVENNRADLSEADLSGADLSGADLSGADLSGADLSGADLSGADLSGAELYRADLSRADLYRADLSGADLSGADLSGVLTINGSMHQFCYFNDHIWIGCLFHHIEYWSLAFDIIGKENGYTDVQIKEYGQYIQLAKRFKEIAEEK